MADSTDEIVPAGWEKRTSRSTGMLHSQLINSMSKIIRL